MTGLRDVDREDLNCSAAAPESFSPVTERNQLIRRDAEQVARTYCFDCPSLAACHQEAVRIGADKLVMAGRYWTFRGRTQVSIPLLPNTRDVAA